MFSDDTKPNWTARSIALSVMVLSLAGSLLLFNKANAEPEPRTVVATSCAGFEADAHKAFDKGGTMVLSGTFAPGDSVRLTVEFQGLGFWWDQRFVGWDSAGVLANAEKAQLTQRTKWQFRLWHGVASGSSTLEVTAGVNTPGDGTISINKPSSVPLFTSLKLTSAGCTAKASQTS